LTLARTSPFDVVLMDIEMPGISGIDTTRLLLQEHPNAKILALSMYNEKGIISKALEAGASGYVLKNVNKEELIEAIKKVAAGEKYYSSGAATALLEKNATKIVTGKKESLPDKLTKRETEILKLVAQGLSNREVAEKLFISPRTVDTHRTNLMEKLQIKNIAGLIRYAIQNGYLE
ncbi:MAG: LuxR C-terminal-related transcriptional regulator, partial [Bacteroidia bacterium]